MPARAQAPLLLEFKPKPHLGDAPRRLRPMPRLRPPAGSRQRVDMVLIGEARHVVVGLRLERAADQPAFGVNAKHRQHVLAPAQGRARRLGQMLDQRGDEDRLAGAREPGHAKAHMRAGGIIDKAPRNGAGFIEKIRDEGQVERSGWLSDNGRRRAAQRHCDKSKGVGRNQALSQARHGLICRPRSVRAPRRDRRAWSCRASASIAAAMRSFARAEGTDLDLRHILHDGGRLAPGAPSAANSCKSSSGPTAAPSTARNAYCRMRALSSAQASPGATAPESGIIGIAGERGDLLSRLCARGPLAHADRDLRRRHHP